MSPEPIKVILVEDHQIVLDSLAHLLSNFDEVKIVGQFLSGQKALHYLESHEVEVIVSDLVMPNMSGVELCLKVKMLYPQIKVIILTMAESSKQIRDALKAGVNGYLFKSSNSDELLRGIQTVANGKRYFSEAVTLELASMTGEEEVIRRPKDVANLTQRELEILSMVAKEMTTNEIADKLFVSTATVETHRRNLMQKLGARSAVGLAIYALKHHLID